MGSHRERPPLLIEPQFSRRLMTFVALTHTAALAALLNLSWWPYRLLAVLVVASLVYHFYVHCLRRAPWSIRSAVWLADGSWQIDVVSGARIDARLAAATYVSVPLVVLNLRSGRWRRWALPLFADALDPEQLRRLRQRLRIEGLRRDATSPAA
ncbi:protein YgfX [uncultured Lamprocystis sp.]|jgi:toxin CptA|uniref:protein YgfX n=1 Tax=uncultured Lamprocystis sp. TaxID=543132 RepID=UPI0025EDE5CC|nr:protein YgfX [uncultured Lamprocystis sp.]